MNLQYFAEESEVEKVTAEPGKVEDETAEKKQEPEKKYTDDDVDRIINKKFAELEEKKQREIDEAKKLAKMNQNEKEQYEVEQMKKRLEEFEKKEMFYTLSKEATNMLAEHDIEADDVMLSTLVKENAEKTKLSVDSFANMYNKSVQRGIEKALSGKSPRVNGSVSGVTKESIMSITNPTERIKAIEQNKHLFN